MNRTSLIVGLCCVLATGAFYSEAVAYNIADFGDFSLRDGLGNVLLPGRLYVPPEAASGARPLMVFLHGGGASGTNNLSQLDALNNGMINAAKTRGAYLYVPQTSDNWGGITRTNQVMTMIDRAVTEQHADTNRLFVTGYSNGGGGTWNMLSRFDGRFAAAVEISGVAPSSDFVASRLVDTPILALHARDDATAPVGNTRNVINGILAAAHDPLPTYLPGSNPSTFFMSNAHIELHAEFRALVHGQGNTTDFLIANPAIDILYYEPAFGGHSGVLGAFSSPEMYDWLFAHNLEVPEPTTIVLLLVALMPLIGAYRFQRLKCICLAIACSVGAYPAHAEDNSFDTNDIQEFLHRNFDGKNAGMVIGVVDEHGSHAFGAGKLDNGTDNQVNGDTLFEIGSVTKTFTVLLLEDMVKRGEMKLDDPVEIYLPKFVKVPSRGGKKITLLNLASQDSGLPFDGTNMTRRDPKNIFADYTADDLYAFLSSYTLTQVPGAEFRYSNAGMALLGNAIERKAGRDFESLMRERICAPLHMDSTYVAVPAGLKPRLATGHDDDGDRHPGMILQVIIPAGGIRSTANDMLKYVSANIGLQPSDLAPLMQQMHVIHHRESLDPISGSRGVTATPWYDDRAHQKPDMDFRGHAGGTAAFSAFAGLDLKRRRGVVVLANQKTRSQNIGWRILQDASLKHTNPATAQPILEIVGLGTTLKMDSDNKTLRIIEIIPNSPAAKAGVATGLIIQKIDGKPIAGLSLAECMKLLTGPAGSKVRLALMDAKGKHSNSVELTRQKFLISS